MKQITKHIGDTAGVYAACIEVGSNGSMASIFMNFETQVDITM
jgi:hypothetical protein